MILGQAWVDKRSFFILHIEGEVAKAPPWWLRSVRVKLSFGDLSGTWLQTSMEAVADVRLLGSHTLTSRILDYRGTDMSASTMLAPTRLQLRKIPSVESESIPVGHFTTRAEPWIPFSMTQASLPFLVYVDWYPAIQRSLLGEQMVS